MNDTNKMLDECIDLATVMRPFLMGKKPPVIMTTLCMLTAEAVSNMSNGGSNEKVLRMVDTCVRDYVSRLEDAVDEAP